MGIHTLPWERSRREAEEESVITRDPFKPRSGTPGSQYVCVASAGQQDSRWFARRRGSECGSGVYQYHIAPSSSGQARRRKGPNRACVYPTGRGREPVCVCVCKKERAVYSLFGMNGTATSGPYAVPENFRLAATTSGF